MTILELKDISREENFIYYRREFTASAVYDLPGKHHTGQIKFTIETEPTGKKDIHVTLIDAVDYPVLPVLKALKDFILAMDREGMLP